MKTPLLFNLAFTACVLLSASQISFAGKTEKIYVYHGDNSARAICVAIAKNQVNRLNRSLKAKKIGKIDNSVHKRFTCNGKNLLNFAEEMGSNKIVQYLSPRFGVESKTEMVNTEKNKVNQLLKEKKVSDIDNDAQARSKCNTEDFSSFTQEMGSNQIAVYTGTPATSNYDTSRLWFSSSR